MATDAAIVVQGLEKHFGRKRAVDGLSLSVPRGTVYGFLGRNGAGKTTTIQILVGLLSPTAGQVRVLGLDPATQGVVLNRRVAYVPESPAMYGWMSVREACRFTAGMWPGWNDGLAEQLRERFGLAAQDKLGTMSRGMKGKVGLLLALAREPELLILDDPTSGLDAVVRREFMDGIIGALSQTGTTVFFSSHIIGDVERIADRVAIIDGGRLVLEGTVDELKAEAVLRAAASGGEPAGVSLEDIFVAAVSGPREGSAAGGVKGAM
jgi:ABC-2 type transport system ATP-binding protein